MWNLKIPPKVKHFFLRSYQRCLPTRSNLANKGVHLDMNRPLCDENIETVAHILLDCLRVRIV